MVTTTTRTRQNDPGHIILLDAPEMARDQPAQIVSLRCVERGVTTLVYAPVGINANMFAIAQVVVDLSALFGMKFTLRHVYPVERLDEAMRMITQVGDEACVRSGGTKGTPSLH
jgi:hypothetical protein